MLIHQSKGFTLIELAIVLIIIGLLIGAGIGIGNTQIQLARISATKQKEEAIKTALISYIARNNRLPCPAVPNLAPGATGYGVEAAIPTGGGCTIPAPGGVITGIVPWNTLGLSDENGSDGYNNRFTYQVVSNAANSIKTNSQTIAGLTGAISIHTATPATIGPPAAGNQSNVCTPIGWVGPNAYNPCFAVVVIVSHGSNGSGAYTSGGIQVSLPTGADELENANNDSKFVVKDYSTATANPFDDIVLALTPQDLLSPLTNTGNIADYTTMTNKNIKEIKAVVIAYAVSHRSFSQQTPPALSYFSYPLPALLDLSPLIPTTIQNDAWGNPINYTPNVTPITASTNSSLSAFTLTSRGPNGTLGDSDDIQIPANVSELQAVFMNSGL